MARKSVSVGDLIVMDRGEIFCDLRAVKRTLREAARNSDNDENKVLIQSGLKELRGEKIVNYLIINIYIEY